VVLPCCGSAGFLRSSKYGVQHFVHARRGTCAWGPETAEHLAIKAAIVRACHAAAYSAETEVAGPDWRADVLAVRGTTRVAFEVQWSVQTLAETVARQERYARDEIRGCWETVQ
jgi:competence protein CoiA